MSTQARPVAQALPEALERAIAAARVKPLPEALLKLLRMAEDDSRTMSELAAVVEQDPGLCARILSAANSPGLRRGAPLNSVAHCLTSLGTRLIRSIATCLALQGMFDRRQETFRTDLAAFWLHSLTVAETARELAVASAYPHAEEAYLAGLLHDIGELLLLSGLGAPYAQVLTIAGEEASLSALEIEHFGIDHAQVGTSMVDHWQFEFAVGDGILFHHASADAIATAGPLPRIVWLAHRLAGEDRPDAATANLSSELLGKNVAAQLDTLRQRCHERSAEIAEALGLTLPPAGTPCLPQVAVASASAEDDATPDGEIEAMMRDMALMRPLQRDLFGIDSDTELLLSLRESAHILFDLSHMAFFLRGADDDRLSAARFGDQPVLFRHALIRTDATRCLVAAAASTQGIVSSFDPDYPQPPALIDLQFARVFGTEGLLCVPLNGRERSIGVMVFGLSSGQYGRLKRRLPWVLNFGRIAALSIEAWHEAIRYRQRAEDEVTARFERQARRVVHEAGNPLGIIKGYLKVLDSKLPEETRVREELGVLREEIDRVASIVRRLSEIPTLAQGSAGTDVALVVREMLALYEASLFKPHAIEAIVTSSDSGSAAACDRDSLKQILLNLWKNAAEAMPNGGRIEITISDDVIHNGRPHVELRIADNGPGIPAAALSRLFNAEQPTTGGERGMGLSIVGALVTQIGASISCRSKPGAGSVFTLILPCRQG